MEANSADGFRSVAFSCEPSMALLRLCELNVPELTAFIKDVKEVLTGHIEKYLLKDAQSNPFNVTPYGIYVNPINEQTQVFRDAGNNRTVRTFMQPFNAQELMHGTHSVVMQQAFLLARAAKLFGINNWKKASEILLQWATGHNTTGLCLFTGIGFKHPVTASFCNYKIPDATMAGFIGRPDDSPYLETSNAVDWNTQEIWDVPFYFTIGAVINLL
jgi:hypothetical protein